MTLLDRYLTRRLIASVFKILLTIVSLFVIIDLLTHRQSALDKYDVPWSVAALYYASFVPTILFEYQAAALSLLVAGLMVLGRSAQDNEVTAMLAGGLSVRRFACAPLVVAFLFSGLVFVAQETVGVQANATARQIEDEFFDSYSTQNTRKVSWPRLQGGWSCHVLYFNRMARTGQDAFLHKIEDGIVQEIRANRIWWDEENEQWLLEDGRWGTFDLDGAGAGTDQRITQMPAPFRETPDELFALDDSADTKSAATLLADIHRAERIGVPAAGHWVDFYAKFARPALCFLMLLIAAPLALRLRRGGVATGLAAGIVIGLVYLMLFYLGVGMGHLELLPPLAAAWLANAVFFVAGLVLFFRAPT